MFIGKNENTKKGQNKMGFVINDLLKENKKDFDKITFKIIIKYHENDDIL